MQKNYSHKGCYLQYGSFPCRNHWSYGNIMQVHRLPLTKADICRPPGTPHVNWVEKRGQEEILQLFCALWRLNTVWIVAFDWHQVLHIQQLQQNYSTRFITNPWLPGQHTESGSPGSVPMAPLIPVSQEAASFGVCSVSDRCLPAPGLPARSTRIKFARGQVSGCLMDSWHAAIGRAYTVFNAFSAAWLHSCAISKKTWESIRMTNVIDNKSNLF